MPISRSCGFRSSVIVSCSFFLLKGVRQLTTESEDRDAGRHFTLHRQRNSQDQFLDSLDGVCFDDRTLVPLATGCQIS